MMKKVFFNAEMLPKCQKKTHKYENIYVIIIHVELKKFMYVAVKTFCSR
jgi:hypothetical protein